jgi:type IX secretion system PorP/SprF family membrane protein
MKKIFLFIAILLVHAYAYAQDPHFSQFFASPLTINPANTGNFSGSLRAALNSRTQLPEFNNAYATKTLSLDAPILKKYIKEDDKLSVGLLILSDQSGNKLLNDNNIAASVSYSKALDENANHSIALGFQVNYSMYRFDPLKANFEDQLTAGGFTGTSSELILGNNFTKNTTDINAGILYTGSTSDNNIFYVGASYYHFAKPTVGFITPTYFTNSRANVHGGAYFSLSSAASLHTSFQYQQQGNTNELIVGGALSYYLGKDNGLELYAGLWSRIKESMIPYVGLEWNHIRAGFTYDIGAASTLASSRFYQSSEFSLIYILENKSKAFKMKCPKF